MISNKTCLIIHLGLMQYKFWTSNYVKFVCCMKTFKISLFIISMR